MPLIDRGGFAIHYDGSGAGKALLMLHANPFDRRLWKFQAPEFARTHRVIRPDLRGYGLSSRSQEPYRLDALLGDVTALLDAEQAGRAVLIGCSVGSRLSMYYALAHPERVAGLVLVGGNSAVSPRMGRRLDGFRADARAYHRAYLRELVAPDFAASDHGRRLVEQFEDVPDLSVPALENFWAASNEYDCTDRLPTLALPALVINGAFDHSLPVGRRTASLIPHAEHVIIEEAGHACCLEKPERFNTVLRDFLDRHNLQATGRAPMRRGQ